MKFQTTAVVLAVSATAASAFVGPIHTRSHSINSPLRASTLEPDTIKKEKTETPPPPLNNNKKQQSLGSRFTNSGMASAAAMATAAVNAAVSMRTLEAPDVKKSYIAMDANKTGIDEDGLPLVYDKDLIESFWSKERGALNKRWSYFVGKAVPFLTKLTTLFIRDGKIAEEEIPALSRQARIDLQDLGPVSNRERQNIVMISPRSLQLKVFSVSS